MPENEVTAVPEATPLTDFQKWSALPEEQQTSSADTETAEPEKVEAATVETDPESAPEKQQDAEADEDVSKPKGLKKRFKQLNGKIRDLETQLAQRAAEPEMKPALASQQPKDVNAPKEADFESYADFIDARADYRYALAKAKTDAEAVSAREATEAKQRDTDWKAKVAETIKRIPDYDEVLGDSDISVSPVMHELILASDAGPDLIYHLAKHPAEAARIQALSPAKAALEMGRLAATFAAPPETKTAVSRAPKPPSIVGGVNALNDPGKEPNPSDFSAWSKWKYRQEAREAAN